MIVAYQNEDWMSTLKRTTPTNLHLLKPMTLQVDIFRCILHNDPSLAKLKINATLPTISLSLEDKRLVQAAHIAMTSFKSNSNNEQGYDNKNDFQEEIDLNMNIVTEDVALARLEHSRLNPGGVAPAETPQSTDLIVTFSIQEVSVQVVKCDSKTGISSPILLLGKIFLARKFY